MPKLRIRREPRYADKIRSYSVILDGDQLGKIKEGQVVEFDVSTGLHQVWLTIDWARSNKLSLEFDRDIDLACRSNVKALFAIVALFQPSSWIRLWQEECDVSK